MSTDAWNRSQLEVEIEMAGVLKQIYQVSGLIRGEERARSQITERIEGYEKELNECLTQLNTCRRALGLPQSSDLSQANPENWRQLIND